MGPIFTLLLIITISLIVNRIATVALTFTGLSREMARFQARSAFTTVGFTTTESENLVNHPVRRQIISLLMLLGNAGLVTIIATVIAQFTMESRYSVFAQLGVLVAGLGLLWVVATNKWIDDRLFYVIGWALKRWTRLEAHDYLALLHFAEGYNVTEMPLEADNWLIGKRLDEVRLADVGVNVLAIVRSDNRFIGNPIGGTYLRDSDKLIVYGAKQDIIALDDDRRDPEGEVRHYQKVAENREKRKLSQSQFGGGQGE